MRLTGVDAKARWVEAITLESKSFTCGFCGVLASSTLGVRLLGAGNADVGRAYVCPNCKGLNQFIQAERYPLPPLGETVEHVPAPLTALYEEVRRCTTAGAYTAAVLACRKGAKEGEFFKHYVEMRTIRLR